MYIIYFYVPTTHVEIVKNAMFEKGAGQIGNYSCCAWQILGEGQFMPLAGSDAYIGSEGKLEKVAEYKVEMICLQDKLSGVITALKATHPYEEPAYQVLRLDNHIE